MKEKTNISHILQRLEPSSELKRSVMERASQLEAGRKTFGNRMAADNRQIQKENITMNAISTKETAYVKKRFPLAVISAAACAAAVIGLAAVTLNKDDTKFINESSSHTSSAEHKEKPVIAVDDESTREGVLTVTDAVGRPYTITDKNRIAAIDALVEKAMTYPVADNCDIPTRRTLEYYVGGEKRTVGLGDEGYAALGVYLGIASDGDDDSGTEYLTITVNGTKHLVERYSDGSPYYDLLYATEKDSPMFFNDKELITYDETAVPKALDIISDIRQNGTQLADISGSPLSNIEKLQEIPDTDLSFTLSGVNYTVGLYEDHDLISIKLYGCIGDELPTAYYENARKWIDDINALMDSVEISEAYPYTSRELSETDVYNNPEIVGYIRIPDLVNAAGQEYISNEVTQHDDNEYYLTHDYVDRTSESGCIFADCNNNVTGEERSDNIILYGQNIRTLGTMFTHLTDLDDGTGDMLNKCPDILFGTVRDDGLAQYAIIGAGCVRLENGSSFLNEYRSFDNDSHTFDSWIKNVKETCSIMRDIDCDADDEYLTLITTVPSDNAEDYRFAVFARKLRSDDEAPELNFKPVKDSPFVIEPVEEVKMPDISELTEEQAVAALNDAGLNCVISYDFDYTEKGHVCYSYAPYYDPLHPLDYVCKGAAVEVHVSLGEYDGERTEPTDNYPFAYPVTKNIKLEVPVPDSMKGSYTFSIFEGTGAGYTKTIDDMSDVESISFDTNEADKMRLVVYAKNNDAKDGKYIRYADFEADHADNTYHLIGTLNTDELLETMK